MTRNQIEKIYNNVYISAYSFPIGAKPKLPKAVKEYNYVLKKLTKAAEKGVSVVSFFSLTPDTISLLSRNEFHVTLSKWLWFNIYRVSFLYSSSVW